MIIWPAFILIPKYIFIIFGQFPIWRVQEAFNSVCSWQHLEYPDDPMLT